MSQYANIKDAFLHCDVDKLILEYCKIPDGESSKVTIERASAEVHAAMERIKQTQPEKAEKQNLLIVCKTFEENETDTFCVEADDIAEWKKRRASKSEQPEEIGDEIIKQQWFGRFILRDNSHIKNFSKWLNHMKDIYDERTGLGFIVKHNPASFFVLKQDQYLSDIIDDLYWKKQHCDAYTV